MTKPEFDEWFQSNLELMTGLGVMHPNSPWGRSIRLSMASVMPTINALTERVATLEAEVAAMKAEKPKKATNG